MKYGLNQCGFPVDDFDRSCRVVADAGYDGVEPTVIADGPLLTAAGRERVRETVERYGLAVPSVSTTLHWDYPLSSADADLRREGVDIARRMIDAAAALDAEDVLLVPAVVGPRTSYPDAYDRAVASIRELAGYASDRDVRLAVENVRNNFLHSPAEFREFLDAVDGPGPVAAYLDIGNAYRSGVPSRWLRELDGRIAKIHIKDWIRDAHRPTYPLQGDIDWVAVRDAFEAGEYDGWITAEVPPYNSYPERTPARLLETLRFLFDEAEGDR
ncbi:sugar phosphate isomerase/epimerase family protein [Haloferacaceae archaeon DSL9]